MLPQYFKYPLIYVEGNNYKFTINGIDIFLNEVELEELIKSLLGYIGTIDDIYSTFEYLEYKDEFEEYLKCKDEFEEWKNYNEEEYKQPYNPRAKIKKMFEERYLPTRTKKEIFKEIAEELGITFKAVEKAYYAK